MRQISLQVTTYPFGSVSQSLANVAQLASSGNVAAIEKEIIQEKSSGKSISQSLVNIALQLACGESTNVNEHLRQAAQILANQAGIPTEKGRINNYTNSSANFPHTRKGCNRTVYMSDCKSSGK